MSNADEKALDDTIDKVASMNVTADKDEKISTKDMVKAIKNLDGAYGKSVIGASIETFSMADGKNKKGDILVDTLEEALATLKKLVELTVETINEKQAKKKKKDKKDPAEKWKFEAVPLEQFDKTMDDVYTSFLLWGLKDAEDAAEKDSGSDKKMYNVSKSYRRLESYADWMYDARKDLLEPKLLPSTIVNAHKQWAMKSSYDKDDRFLWWFDLSWMNLEALKKVPPEESVRYFVWYCHYVMFDEKARKNGIVIVENLDKLGFWAAFTIIPPKVGAKLDRLTIGVLPVKMKKFYFTEGPKWMNIIMAIMSPFMSKKMKSRMSNLNDDYEALTEALGGPEYMYENFGKSKGGLMKGDVVTEKYFA